MVTSPLFSAVVWWQPLDRCVCMCMDHNTEYSGAGRLFYSVHTMALTCMISIQTILELFREGAYKPHGKWHLCIIHTPYSVYATYSTSMRQCFDAAQPR